jgi:hypothetical protein
MPVTLNRIRAVSLGGNTSGALAVVSTGTLFLAGGNNITLSQNGQSVTISGAAGGPGGGFAGGGISGGNTAGDTGSVTGRLIFAGGNNVTLSGSTNGGSMTITVSAFNQSTQTQMTGLTAGLSDLGNTLGTSGLVSNHLVLAGGNNITLSGSVNGQSATITISGAAGGGNFSAGLTNIGNTAGDTGLVGSRLVLAGGNNITLSGSTDGQSITITVSAPNLGAGAGFTAGISTQGNTAGTTGLVGSQIQFVGMGGVTLSQSVNGNSATLSIRDHARSNYRVDLAYPGLAASSNTSNAALSLFYLSLPAFINVTKMDFQASMSQATQSSGGYSISIGFYTLSGSTASLASSASATRSWTNGTAGSNSTQVGGMTGYHHRTIPVGTISLVPGEYLVGFWMRTTGAAQTWSMQFFPGQVLTGANADTNETQNWDHGYFSASFSTAMPGSVNLTDTAYIRSSNLNRALAMRLFAEHS